MREHGWGGAERAEEEHVLGRIGEMVLAADDVADAHGDVIDHDREVIQRRTVRTRDDEIAAQRAGIDADASTHEIVEFDGTCADAEAHDRGPAFRTSGLALHLVEPGTATHVGRVQPRFLARRAIDGQFLRRAETRVGLVLAQQLLDGGSVGVTALGLAVGSERSARRFAGHLGSLVPCKTEPVQTLEDVALELERRTGGIGVFETQHEGAAGLTREEIVV